MSLNIVLTGLNCNILSTAKDKHGELPDHVLSSDLSEELQINTATVSSSQSSGVIINNEKTIEKDYAVAGGDDNEAAASLAMMGCMMSSEKDGKNRGVEVEGYGDGDIDSCELTE